MRTYEKKMILGILIIILSSFLGKLTINIIYLNQNLTGEYEFLLKGFMNSYMISGLLIYIWGITDKFK